MRRRGAGSVGRWADARDMEEAGRLPDGSANCILHHLEFRLVLARFVFLLRCRFQVTNYLFDHLSLELLNCADSFLGIQKQNASLGFESQQLTS